MTYLVKKDAFTLPTTAQSVPVTGVGFQPKALILWCNGATASGFAAQLRMSFGFATSPSQRWHSTIRAGDNVAAGSSNRVRRSETTLVLVPSMTTGASADMTLDLDSFDADGFTLDLLVPLTGVAYVVHYIALGGDELTNAFVGNVVPSAGTGNKAVTGVGFRPDLVITSEINNAAGAGGGASANFALSAFTATQQGVATIRDRDATSPTQVTSYQRSDQALVAVQSGSDAIDHEAAVSSMDADGFTLNFSTHTDATIQYGFLCLKGGLYDVRAETQRTSTGTKSTTGLGFRPSGLLLFGTNKTASSSIDLTQDKLSVGGSDGTTEGGTWVATADAATTTDTDVSHSVTKILQHATVPATLDAEADCTFDADGYTLDWTTADAVAREFISVAFGSPTEILASDTPFVIGGRGAC